jgi:hypothetical protein
MPRYAFKYSLIPPEPPSLVVWATGATSAAAQPEAEAKARYLARERELGPLLDCWEEEPSTP